jgi:hypothetical protein
MVKNAQSKNEDFQSLYNISGAKGRPQSTCIPHD